MTAALLVLPPPAPLPSGTAPPQPADIEFLVQWALSRTGNLPWSRDRDVDLSFDRGLTARPRKRPPVNWTIAIACAGMHFTAPPLPARMSPDDDTETIIRAIKSLEPRAASLVLACARAKIRPDWTVDGKTESELVTKEGYGLRKKGKHWKRVKRRRTFEVWEPSREAICAARGAYTLWHEALLLLSERLQRRLSRWRPNGLAAPVRPWELPLQKSA